MEYKKQHKKAETVIITENKLVVAREEGKEGWAKWAKGSGRYWLPVMGCVSQRDERCCPGIQSVARP